MKGKNNDALKKHHFWILAGLAPLLVFLAVIFLMTGVSGAIEKKVKEVADKEKEVGGATAPGTGMLKDIDVKKEKLGKVRGELWKLNWDKQAEYFTWPETPDGLFDKYNTVKFGEKNRDFIKNQALIERLKPAYSAAYEKLGTSVGATKMKGGWQAALRYVSDWGAMLPESQQLWIAMEDVWMQRALLGPINAVNRSISELKPVAPLNTPLKRKFVSRVWEMDLEVAAKGATGGGRVLKGKLKNRTGQLQVLGNGSAMKVNVWFDPKTYHLPPFEFRIEGAGVPGGETIDIPPLPSHVIPPNLEVLEIARVEQVLDSRTVPIRRLDRLAIGYLSSKDYGKELKAGTYWVEAAGATAESTTTTPKIDSGGDALTPMGAGGGTATSTGSGIINGRSGGMRLTDIADGSRKRYVEVNEQLRRVPVAFTLVVDQMYVNDVLIAYANSALRFETSQVHWSRFGESLAEPTTGSVGGEPSVDGSSGGETVTATGFAGYGLSMQGGPGGGGMRAASRSSATMGAPSTSTSSMMSMAMSGSMSGGIPGLGAESLSSVSEAQANAGLVQLTVYGIITLYERYDAPKSEGETPMPETPKPEEPKTEPAKTESAKTDEPKTEPKKEEPKKEEPKPEPKKDEPKKEEPKTEPKKDEKPPVPKETGK